MAIDMFIEIEGVAGDSRGQKGQIDVLAWSWGASSEVRHRQLPLRIRLAKAAHKKQYLAAAGFEVNGQRIKSEEEKAKEKAEAKSDEKTVTAAAAAAAAASLPTPARTSRRRRRGGYRYYGTPSPSPERAPMTEDQLIFQDLLDRYESDDEDIETTFDDDECTPAKNIQANVQDMSFTKYVDSSSPTLYAMTLAKHKGVRAVLRMYRPPPRRQPAEEEEEAKQEGDAPSKYQELLQEFIFHDVMISSVSTGGSGGEDRLTENVTISFSKFEFSFIDPTIYNKRRADLAARKVADAKKAADAKTSSEDSSSESTSSSSASATTSSSSSSSAPNPSKPDSPETATTTKHNLKYDIVRHKAVVTQTPITV